MKTKFQVSSFRSKAFLSAGFCLLVFIAGCGYAVRSVYVGPYKTIYVEPFVNKVDIFSENATELSQRFRTYYPLLEADLRTAVINRFMYDGGLRIAAKDEADLILKGELLEYRRDPLRYENNQEDVVEYRISLIMHLTVYKKGEEKPLWDEANFVGDTTYFTTGAQAILEKSALDNAISDLARRAVERMIENW